MTMQSTLRTLLCTGLLSLGALMSGVAHAANTKPESRLLDGWEKQTHPLFHSGPGLADGTYAWRVPTILPRGEYRLISRHGDKAEVIDGYSFEIDGSIYKEIRLMLPSPYTGVEAIKAEYVSMK